MQNLSRCLHSFLSHTVPHPFPSFLFIYPHTCESVSSSPTRACTMLRRTSALFLRPRHIPFTPPPLSKRTGDFHCRHCSHTWHSDSVWVTKTTQRVYQGETCNRCGTTTKPYYVGRPNESVFNRVHTPHAVKPGASSSRHGKKLKHVRYNWRIPKGRL